MKKATKFFRGLKQWCIWGFHCYYKQWNVVNEEKIPTTGPVIFIPTHQNAFLDAMLVICSGRRNPWSIARASVFKKGFVTFLLTAVQIKPVFRMRDGFSSLKNNDAIMQEWTNMLGEGQDITIFAEGNHNEPYARGTLQRGFARMALKFQQQYNAPLTIVPVGIHYDHHRSFRSRVLVYYGDAIVVSNAINAEHSERENLDKLCDITEESLNKLAIKIEADDQYKARYDFLIKYRKVEKDMLTQLETDRKVLAQFPTPPTPAPIIKQGNILFKVINPIVWIGVIGNFIPYALIKRFISKNIKDPQWIASLKFAFGIFLVPIYYLIVFIILWIAYPSWPVFIAAALLIPLCGLWATDILKR